MPVKFCKESRGNVNCAINKYAASFIGSSNFEIRIAYGNISGVSKTDNIKSSSEDKTSFTALAREINQPQEELNLTHDYKFDESIDKENLTE